MLELTFLRYKDYLKLSGTINVDTRGQYKREVRVSEGDVIRSSKGVKGREKRFVNATLLVWGMREGIPTEEECRWPLEAEKSKETDSLLELPERIYANILSLELLNSRSIR